MGTYVSNSILKLILIKLNHLIDVTSSQATSQQGIEEAESENDEVPMTAKIPISKMPSPIINIQNPYQIGNMEETNKLVLENKIIGKKLKDFKEKEKPKKKKI